MTPEEDTDLIIYNQVVKDVTKPIVMEQLKQILQLYADGVSIHEIGRRIGISRNSVRKYLQLLNTSTENLSGKDLADNACNKKVPLVEKIYLLNGAARTHH